MYIKKNGHIYCLGSLVGIHVHLFQHIVYHVLAFAKLFAKPSAKQFAKAFAARRLRLPWTSKRADADTCECLCERLSKT